MPDEYGMNLAPNTASSMAVQMNEMIRKPAPYTSQCMDDWKDTNLTVPKATNYSLSVRKDRNMNIISKNHSASSVNKSVTKQQ